MDYKWYDFILKMHTLYQGTHVHLDKVTTTRYFLSIPSFSSVHMEGCFVRKHPSM
jgi:hypothetical protein